jgi:hypothetical protein
MVVAIATLKSYFETGSKPSQSDWNNLFDTLADLQERANNIPGSGIDLTIYLRKDQDDATTFVLRSKNFRIGGVDKTGAHQWAVDFDGSAIQYFDFTANDVLTIVSDLTNVANQQYFGRSITLIGRNTDSSPHTIGLDADNGAPTGCFVTNGQGAIIVPVGKRLTVTVTVLNAGTGVSSDNLIAVAYGVQT